MDRGFIAKVISDLVGEWWETQTLDYITEIGPDAYLTALQLVQIDKAIEDGK